WQGRGALRGRRPRIGRRSTGRPITAGRTTDRKARETFRPIASSDRTDPMRAEHVGCTPPGNRKGPKPAERADRSTIRSMNDVYILSAARTPIGKFGGGLSTTPATHLGATAIRAAVQRSGIAPEHVDEVIMGQVIQAGAGQAPARQAALRAGLPDS